MPSAAGPALTGPDEAGWFQRISDDFPNLRRAVDRLMHGGAAATVLEIATALKPFFMAREPLGLIGRTWVDSALGAAGDADAGLVAKALATAGLLAWNTGDTPAAEQRQAKALEMARSAGDSHLIFQAASDLGVSALDRGDIRRARPLFEEALQLARRFEDPARLAWATSNLAQVAGRADQPVLLDDALELHRQAGRASGVAHVALMHGCLALAGGRPGAASEWFEVSREGWSQLGNGAAEVVALCGLADVARLRGDLSGASANARRALDAGTALGFELGIACSLTSLGAAAALSEGQREAAGEHLERAAGLWQQVGMAPGRARALGLLGAMSAATEGPGGASELFREAGALWGSVDRTAGVGWVRALEAGCALGSGDAGTAFDQARAAVELLRQGAAGPAVLDGLLSPETGGAADVIDACEILGLAAAGLGNPGLGVAILTAATELRETCGVRHDGRRLLQVRAALRTGRRLLGPEATQAAIADGREVARGGPVALMAAAI